MRIAPLLALALVAAPALAQMAVPGAPDPKRVAAGTYAIEPEHTQVGFTISHLGITPYHGTFSGASGQLVLDPAHPDQARLTVELPIASVQTTSDKLTDELKSADWFDAGQFPTAKFVSSRVAVTGNAAVVNGTLTLHGVSKPATFAVKFYGAGANPMSNAQSVGFTAVSHISRSAFGVSKYVPIVGDDVTLLISAAFERGDPTHTKS